MPLVSVETVSSFRVLLVTLLSTWAVPATSCCFVQCLDIALLENIKFLRSLLTLLVAESPQPLQLFIALLSISSVP